MNADDLNLLQQIEQVGEGFLAPTLVSQAGGVPGAPLLLQLVLIAERVVPGKRLLSLQTVFAQGGVGGKPVEASVETLHHGRSFAFLTISLRQGEILLTRAEAVLTADEPDYLSHVDVGPPPVAVDRWLDNGPGIWPGTSFRSPDSSMQELSVRLTLDESNVDATVMRGLVAAATEPAVMSAIMHFQNVRVAGLRQGFSNVLTQSVTFLQAADPAAGVVIRATPRHVGGGRVQGDGTVVDPIGRPIALFSTTGVLRGQGSVATSES